MINFNLLKTNIEEEIINVLKLHKIDYERIYEKNQEEESDIKKILTDKFIIWIYSDTLQLFDKNVRKKEIYREVWDFKTKNEQIMADDFIIRLENYLTSIQ